MTEPPATSASRPRPRPPGSGNTALPDSGEGSASGPLAPEAEPEAGAELGDDEPEADEPEADEPDDEPEADEPDDEPEADEPDGGGGTRARRRILIQGGVGLALLVVVALVLVVIELNRSSSSGSHSSPADQSRAALDDQATANAFVAAAATDIAVVTTYDYRSLDSTLTNGATVTTGAYAAAFRSALNGSLGAQARALHRVQTFSQTAAGIGTIAANGRSAMVLVFGTQTVTDDDTAQKPRSTPVTLTATIVRSGDRYLISALTAGGNAGLPPGTRALDVAAEAARETVADVLTLRHGTIDADLNRALDSTTGPLRTQLDAQLASARSSVAAGGYDLNGTVTAIAVEQASGTSVVLLVAATGTRTDPGQQPQVVSIGQYQVTVSLVGTSWLTSALTTVATS